MDRDHKIDITGVGLVKFVQEAYALSRPQGLGFLHFKDEPLSEADAKTIIDRERDDSHVAASMDYVHGRACKMTVWRDGDALLINDGWYDHSPADLAELLARCGIKQQVAA